MKNEYHVSFENISVFVHFATWPAGVCSAIFLMSTQFPFVYRCSLIGCYLGLVGADGEVF